MLRTPLLTVLLVTGLLTSVPVVAQLPAAPPATAREPLVQSGKTQKLSEHVWYISDESVGGVPNVGFIVGRTGTLVVETGMGPPNGRTVLAEALKLSGNTRLYLVTTHVHPEHDLGAQAFPATTTFIRSTDQVREIGEEGMRTADAFRGRSAVNARLLEGAAFRPADQTFSGSLDLDLGGVKVRILALGPNHTQGDTAVFVEGEKILFAGDTAMRAMPAFASSKSGVKQWLSTLDRLEALQPAIIVPSHGPNGDVGYIRAYRTYLTFIQGHTAAAKAAGKTVDQAVEQVSAELRTGGFDTGRAAAAIRSAYAEAG